MCDLPAASKNGGGPEGEAQEEEADEPALVCAIMKQRLAFPVNGAAICSAAAAAASLLPITRPTRVLICDNIKIFRWAAE